MVAYTAKDSGIWTEMLIEDTSRNKCNLIIETTLRNKNVATKTVEKLFNRGYDIHAKIFVVSFDKSLLGSYARYEVLKAERGTGRFVFDHALVNTYNGMLETVQAVKNQEKCTSIHLYTREGIFFDGDYRQTDIVSIIKKERYREYTQSEIKFLQQGWKKVNQRMKARCAEKDEYIEIATRMTGRIKMMKEEGVAEKNINVMNEIYLSDWI